MKFAAPVFLLLAWLMPAAWDSAWATVIPPAADASKPEFRLLTIEGLRDRVFQAGHLLEAGELDAAEGVALDLAGSFERAMAASPGKYHCFLNQAAFERFRAGYGSAPLVWLEPTYCDALFIAGLARAHQNDWVGSIAALNKVMAFAPYEVQARIEAGYVLQRLERPETAIRAYREALNLIEKLGLQPAVKGRVLRGIGSSYIDLGQYDEARVWLNRAIDEDEFDLRAFESLHYIDKLTSSTATAMP
ncbi:MAG: tetratricopeptide repeat protein [Gammaproteobacteria bacterium]|nr:tetratricopeptide repeat protein [Gammaproteobacteria bacterium]